jgi:hypothetical protein
VTEDHVKAIVSFLTDEYSKAGLGILAQEQTFEKLTIDDVKKSIRIIQAQLYKEPIETEKLTKILSFIVKQGHTTLDELKTKFALTDNYQARPLIATLKTEGLLHSKSGYYPTPKLIEAYQVTDGFLIGIIGNIVVPQEPPTPKKRDNKKKRTINQGKNQQQLNESRGFYSETDKEDNSD